MRASKRHKCWKEELRRRQRADKAHATRMAAKLAHSTHARPDKIEAHPNIINEEVPNEQ